MKPCHPLLPASLVLLLTSCSFVERNTVGLFRNEDSQTGFMSPAVAPAKADPQTVTVEVRPSIKNVEPPAAPNTRVEIVWEIPKDSVDGFVIRYGFSRTDLRYSERVQSAELDRMEDPKFGFVYRYVLKNMPPEKTVFVTLAAFTGALESEPSSVFEVVPVKVK